MNVRSWLITLAILMACAPPAFSQVDNGRIAGIVRDSSSAFAPGVNVKITNERTGEDRTAVTNDQGYFLVTPLKPSTYTIRVERAGFAAIEYTAMPLAIGQELTLDFELKPAGVTEAVTVVGTAPVLDLSSAKIGVNLGEREVNNLPVNGRQMSQLMLQAPGSQNAGTGTWSDIRFSGRAVEQNAIRYDGIEGSAIIDASPGNLNGEIATPFKLQASLENVQEFRVESSAYPAEFGTGSGGQVSVVTKSGANDFHGAAFEYLRRDALDAPNYFDTTAGLPKSLLKQDQFGGSLGGPIVKNRAFFFGSFERYRLNAGINIVEAMPSAAAWSRAVPAIAALRPGFLAPGAVILSGQSTNPDFDIAQLQTPQIVTRNRRQRPARLQDEQSLVELHSSVSRPGRERCARQRVRAASCTPRPIPATRSSTCRASCRTGRRTNSSSATTPRPHRIAALCPERRERAGGSIINLTGSVANNGIAGQGSSSGITVPGGLVRVEQRPEWPRAAVRPLYACRSSIR